MKRKANKELNEIKKHWEKPDIASLKDKNLQALERAYILESLKAIGNVNYIADIGCGDCSDTIYWQRYAKRVFGYDYSSAMIEKARKRHKDKIKLFHFDILQDNLSEKFNVVITKRCLINLGISY